MMVEMGSDLLTGSDAGIALIGARGDGYGRILRANSRLSELLGRPMEALVGTRLCQHLPPEDHARAHTAFLGLMAQPQTLYEHDGRLAAADGSTVCVQALASAIATRNGLAIVLRVLAPPHSRAPIGAPPL